ncbi:MAG: YpmA family protein [Syntrophomonadaceae bacterium]|nr:YpmA family protein [Syntrophomonadaceae bacterium]
MAPAAGKLQLLATRTLNNNEELYKVVDFLNKTLKEYQLMFGLTKNTREGTMTISIYEV